MTVILDGLIAVKPLNPHTFTLTLVQVYCSSTSVITMKGAKLFFFTIPLINTGWADSSRPTWAGQMYFRYIMKGRIGLMSPLSELHSLWGKSEWSYHSVRAVCPQDQLNKHLSSVAQCPHRSLAQAYPFTCIHRGGTLILRLTHMHTPDLDYWTQYCTGGFMV